MKQLNEEQKTLLSKAYPVTRFWLITLLNNGGKLNQAVRGIYLYLNTVEANIYRKWHQNCLEEMKRIKLHICVPELFTFISSPQISVVKALSSAQKQYTREKNKTRQKHIGKMVSLIQRLADSESRLYTEAKKELLNNKTENVLEEIALRIENADEIEAENKLYTRQSVKHYNRLIKLGQQPEIHELRSCLNAQFSGDAELFTKQVSIVCSTYKQGKDVPADVKDICFNFIKASISSAGYLHANLIDYIFKNDEISERAFQLFCDAEEQIRLKGMAILPANHAAKMATRKGLYNKSAAEMSDSDVRILRIERMFKK